MGGVRGRIAAVIAAVAGLTACAAGGSCACLWDRETGLLYAGCPCRRDGECASGKCRKRVCR